MDHRGITSAAKVTEIQCPTSLLNSSTPPSPTVMSELSKLLCANIRAPKPGDALSKKNKVGVDKKEESVSKENKVGGDDKKEESLSKENKVGGDDEPAAPEKRRRLNCKTMDAKNEQPDKSGSSQHQDDEQLQKHEDLKPQLTFAPTTSRPPATPQSKKLKSNGNGDVDAAVVYFEQWKKTPDKIKIAKRLHSSVWHLDIRV